MDAMSEPEYIGCFVNSPLRSYALSGGCDEMALGLLLVVLIPEFPSLDICVR